MVHISPFLHTLRRLEAHIDSAFLGPPLPRTDEQRRQWIDPPIDLQHIPLVDRWVSPKFLPTFRKGFILLGPNTVCFQRGYGPGEEVMNQYAEMISACFGQSTPAACLSLLKQCSYDFLVFIMAETTQIAAACMVEFHTCAEQIPYLFISDLCTDPQFRAKGFAHQLVHAVHTLGSLLATIPQKNAWKDAVPSDKIVYIGLTVNKTPESSVEDHIVHLYTECGLSTRDKNPSLPIIDYDSFTPYSDFNWHLEGRPDCQIGMWKCITPYTLYEDANGAILHPSSEDCKLMYHTFPNPELERVRRHGIVHPHHKELTPLQDDAEVYVGGDEFITFQSEISPNLRNTSHFIICTNNTRETFRPRISVPPWFACQIGAYP